jgi:hypothetical protein
MLAAKTVRPVFDKRTRGRSKPRQPFESQFTVCSLTGQSFFKFAGDELAVDSGSTLARDDENIACRRQLGAVAPEIFAHLALDAIAHD